MFSSGSGWLFQVKCLPSNKSNKLKSNWKHPCVFILDSEDKNPLHCTDVFKRVSNYFCYSCPSLNGLIGACGHLGKMATLFKFLLA